MKPGPRPKPAALKELAGNPGRRPIARTAIDALPAAVPDCPPHLDDQARAEWERITALVGATGLLRQTDRTVLAAYCQCYSRWIAAEEKLRRTGPVVMGPEKMPIENPYLAIANRALVQLRQFMAELGFSPATRPGVRASTVTEETGDAEFFRRSPAEK